MRGRDTAPLNEKRAYKRGGASPQFANGGHTKMTRVPACTHVLSLYCPVHIVHSVLQVCMLSAH